MEGESVKYNGNTHLKQGFRTFVYNKDGEQKLMNSWVEYEAHIAAGLWFTNRFDIPMPGSTEEVSAKPVVTKLVTPKKRTRKKASD